MKIAVDFDGTCVDHRFPEVGPDVPDAVQTLKALASRGDYLFLYTMRSGEYLEDAVQWFVEREIPLSGINSDPSQTKWTSSPKCYAELYIDDAAFGCPLFQPLGFKRKCVKWNDIRRKLLHLKSSVDVAMEKS